ncbi:hypothetical protein [Yersinia nurmii]|nr:hypothetical protein [Yersinia nurmii]
MQLTTAHKAQDTWRPLREARLGDKDKISC